MGCACSAEQPEQQLKCIRLQFVSSSPALQKRTIAKTGSLTCIRANTSAPCSAGYLVKAGGSTVTAAAQHCYLRVGRHSSKQEETDARTYSDGNTKRIQQASIHAQYQGVNAQHPTCPAGQDAERPEIQRTPCVQASQAQPSTLQQSAKMRSGSMSCRN